MGPEGTKVSTGKFTDNIPPSFNRRDNYESYRDDVLLWTSLADLDDIKRRPALVLRIGGEAKTYAKTIY